MDWQPCLETRTVQLRPLRRDDWDALFAIASDRELWAQHPMHDRWQEPVFRDFFEEALSSGGALTVTDPARGQIVGSTRYQYLGERAGDEVEIGWTFLARSAWGTGLNTEMKRLMLTHALGRVERVVFRIGRDNLRSRRAVEKLGARLTAEVEQVATPDKGLIEHLVYEIRRSDLDPASPAP